MNIIFLGAPGAGKGTQSEIISKKFNIPVIGTGSIIRESVKAGTELGKQVKAMINAGTLVPDEMILNILKDRLAEDDCQNGFILDGAPRTIAQAEELEKLGIRIDHVIEIAVNDELIIERLTGRKVCSACGASYHNVFMPSSDPSKCDRCGGELIVRKDDNLETAHERLTLYHNVTEPLKNFYGPRGILYTVDGETGVEKTTRLMLDILEA